MHHSLQIMFILPLMTGHLFWKATILSGLNRGVSLYIDGLVQDCRQCISNGDAGGRLNKKDGLTRYGDSHVKDKTS